MMRIRIARRAFPGSGSILRDIAFDLAAGDSLAVLGPSGAGKSTLLRIVAGLDTGFEGRVEGRPERIGFQFQSPALLPWRSALDNIVLACREAEEGMRWLDRLGVGHVAALFPHQLSLGMARRVSLARALAVGPSLLILDEPTASLDRASATQVHEAIAEVMRQHRPITLIATHEPREAVALASAQLVLGADRPRAGEDAA